MNALKPGLPPLPARMAHLPIDARGFPVPFFVAVVNGVPDHRVMDGSKMPRAINRGLCWLCGNVMRQRVRTFTIGPMCCITRTISEPPAHHECALYAVRACPFLTRPHAKRRTIGLPEEAQEPAGVGLKRNPGAICLWTTGDYKVERLRPGSHEGNPGILFALGEPIRVEWFAEGRPATREEVEESVSSGIHLLEIEAQAEGRESVLELTRRRMLFALQLQEHGWPS